jgi:NAD+ kinase
MNEVIFVVYPSRTDGLALLDGVSRDLLASGVTLRTHVIGRDGESPEVNESTVVVSLGGDGTFLHAARIAHSGNAVVLGVNLGRVGFLLPVAPTELLASISEAIRGDMPIENRVVLEMETPSGHSEFAVNEIVLERASPGHMVRVRTRINGDEMLTYSADGVMVATPTGSTGYSFSAGGPVLATGLDAFVVTPVAPHFTIDRSIVVDANTVVELHALDRPALAVVDGEQRASLEPGDSVTIRRSRRPVRVGTPIDSGFGARLRHSLREGHAQ